MQTMQISIPASKTDSPTHMQILSPGETLRLKIVFLLPEHLCNAASVL